MNSLITKEYLGNKIEFKMINGMVYANANSMTDSVTLDNWKRSANTKRYIEALEKTNSVKSTERELIISKRGGIASEQGTWIHEKLILSLARYISVEFELWCDEQIATLLREGTVSLKPKTEEEMLIELFGKSNMNLISLTAQSIRETKKLKIENKHKNNIIDGLTGVVDGVLLRKTCTDYVNKVSFETGVEHSIIYYDIYSLVGRMLKKDLKKTFADFKNSIKKLVENNKSENKQKNLKGDSKLSPFKLSQTRFYVSMMEYIVDELGQGVVVLEAMAKVFEIGIEEIIEKHNYYREVKDLEERGA